MINNKRYQAFHNAVIVPRVTEELDGKPYTYRVWGDSDKVILCLPGWPATSLLYGPFAAGLSGNYTIIALDFPGWGGASLTGAPLLKIEDYVGYMRTFIKEKIPEKYTFLGYSFGSVVAEFTADMIDKKPEALFLISPLRGSGRILFDPVIGSSLVFTKILRDLGAPLTRVKRFVKVVYDAYFKASPYGKILKQSPYWSELYEEILASDPRSVFSVGNALIGTDTLAYEDENIQTFVCYGEKDFWFVKKDAQEIAESAGRKPVIATEGDHFHFLVQPEKCIPYIQTVLDSVWPSP